MDTQIRKKGKWAVWEAFDFGGACPISYWNTKDEAEKELNRLLNYKSIFASYAVIKVENE